MAAIEIEEKKLKALLWICY